MNLELFGVVDREGKLRHNTYKSRSFWIYDDEKTARRMCRQEGDCIVRVTVHLDQEPIFIKAKRLGG